MGQKLSETLRKEAGKLGKWGYGQTIDAMHRAANELDRRAERIKGLSEKKE